MKKLLILRSVTKRARAYADRHFRYFTFFDCPKKAIEDLKGKTKDERPHFVIVDASTGVNAFGLNTKAMNLGYIVETKGVA